MVHIPLGLLVVLPSIWTIEYIGLDYACHLSKLHICNKKSLNCIRLITPTTNEDRLGKVLLNAKGFVYYVSITGITGTQTPDVNEVSYNLKKLLLSLNEENILFLMDDGLLSKYVNNSEFENLYKDFLKKEMNYLNLKSLFFINKSSGCSYSELPPGTNYRSAIAPSFWKKSILLSSSNEN